MTSPMPCHITDQASSPWDQDENRLPVATERLTLLMIDGEPNDAVIEAADVYLESFHNSGALNSILILLAGNDEQQQRAAEIGRKLAQKIMSDYVEENLNALLQPLGLIDEN